MMHKAWSSIEEVPYCFSRSSIKFQGHIALEIVEFDSNWAFPDCNSSLNSTMAMKCCTKLETAKKRCPIVFQGHPSNFKVTQDKTSPILTQIGRFGLQASRSFQIPQICLVQGHLLKLKVTQDKKIVDFDPNWAFPDCNSSLNSHMMMKWCIYMVRTGLEKSWNLTLDWKSHWISCWPGKMAFCLEKSLKIRGSPWKILCAMLKIIWTWKHWWLYD